MGHKRGGRSGPVLLRKAVTGVFRLLAEVGALGEQQQMVVVVGELAVEGEDAVEGDLVGTGG